MTSPLRILALTGALALGLTACKKPQEQAAPPPPDVGVIEAKAQTLPLQRELVGRLSPFRSADVRARVSGVLASSLCRVSRVSTGSSCSKAAARVATSADMLPRCRARL